MWRAADVGSLISTLARALMTGNERWNGRRNISGGVTRDRGDGVRKEEADQTANGRKDNRSCLLLLLVVLFFCFLGYAAWYANDNEPLRDIFFMDIRADSMLLIENFQFVSRTPDWNGLKSFRRHIWHLCCRFLRVFRIRSCGFIFLVSVFVSEVDVSRTFWVIGF